MEPIKPIKKIRVGGVCATIWKNTSKDGRTYSTVSLERSYKDSQGEWKSTTSFRQSDLPTAAVLLNEALRFLTLEDSETIV